MAESWSSSGMDVHLDWRPESGRTGLAAAIRAAIREGRWQAGAAVPSTRALAQDLGVARGTVTRVYADLAAEGYLRTAQGAPTRVATAGALPASPPRPVPRDPAPRWDLRPGRPNLSAFPRSAWLAATRRALQQAPASAFDYPGESGAAELRETLAAYLARSRGVVADPERILVCSGFSHAMAILARVLHARGADEIAFENPSLNLYRDIAAANGPRVVGVPVDDHGIAVSALDSPAVVVTPAHQYPLGVTLAPRRRAELTRWAEETGAVVIEDDYDGEFRFDHQQVGALQALAPERVVYVGTTSKTLAPALRLGWMVLPRFLVEPVRAELVASGARPALLDQLAMAELIESGAYDQHIRRCRAEYRSRRDRLLAALPDSVLPQGISAGLHLVLQFPGELPREMEVMAACRRRAIGLEGLSGYWIGEPRREGLIIGYGAAAKHAFGGATQALREAIFEVT
ncbi:PLP-dependent aminotransferase family protein [Amycolatopsis sp. BJA-103]|uniref:MocR-like pyridoxine biosynthesis transcription factor PdxR n=1 Tax=Amycolatopsis sp. BJA-103 TaxID=1911175 RepID=UPI000C787EBF|nr:PLP-dependent aminotransferase family protein [Amycolatopsis sp. BJA-103]AUI61158.1 GntR family transcriptional regulator [Amycolatopsis sp. BJA-103]PNE21555.1 GntR family transcriptional regulator [Amycolatopsis sp. BJA-103]